MTFCWKKPNDAVVILQRYIKKIQEDTLTDKERKNMLYFIIYDFTVSHPEHSPELLEYQEYERMAMTGVILASIITQTKLGHED